MQMPDVKHPKVFRISGVSIQVLSFMPLSDDEAGRIAMHLWRTQAAARRSKGKLLVLPWLGDAATTALLPPLPPQRR